MMIAKASGKSLPISTKQSVEICNFIKGKTTEKAKKLLQEVINQKMPVPFKRFNRDVAHKRGKIAAGRYPQKASSHILKLVNSAEANAQNKGLATPYIIKEIKANKASKTWHHGRQRRRQMKRTNIDIMLIESKKPKVEKKESKVKIVEKKPEKIEIKEK